MNGKNNLTTGNVGKVLLCFVLPYLLSCFMQTFYGMADLFVVGQFYGSEVTTAVSIGSQVTHMLTVIIVGLAMGATVRIGRAVGAGDKETAAQTMGTTIVLFSVFALVLTAVLLLVTDPVIRIMLTPEEAVADTRNYLLICFAGIPFIVAYNVISSVFRGAGDSRSPMCVVAVACVINILLDFLLIGGAGMGAAGAALATISGQAASVLLAVWVMRRRDLGFSLTVRDIRIHRGVFADLLKVGVPVAMQDGLIQVAFVVITIIANSRGLVAATSVGIVEKLISFLFLVPSAFLSAISAITAQNMGAGKAQRARQSLCYGLLITVSWGLLCSLYHQFFPATLVGLFTKDIAVLAAGSSYMRAYCFDCLFAAVHFCFSGYFCGEGKSGISFLHNMASILLMRVPGAYLASIYFPETLYPMGWAAPLGSLLSALICIGFYMVEMRKRNAGHPVELERIEMGKD